MASTLVTGAAGFIGRALVRALGSAGHEVILFDRSAGDVTDAAAWARLAAADHVFHLAGNSYVPESWNDPAGFFHTNVTGTKLALEYCRAQGAHLVFASGYVYGVPQRLPIREDDPIRPNNPYAESKAAAERACASYVADTNLPVTVLRPFNVFGPGQRREFLIPTILHQVRSGNTIRVQNLAPRRDYVFVDDVVAALIRTIAEPRGHRLFNIGSGTSHSVQEVVDAIQAVAGTNLPVVSDAAPRVNEIAEVRADITRARDQLGWAPRYTLVEGLECLLAAE